MAALLLASGVRISAEPSSTPRLDWVFDNQVTGTARIGNTLYAGGWFTSVAPAAGELSRLFELSPSTGARRTKSWSGVSRRHGRPPPSQPR